MSYLFGDSTPSPLTSNFIEFLRDALDFTVQALLVEERIRGREEEVAAARKAADRELARLGDLRMTLISAFERVNKGAEGSATARCAELLLRTSEEAIVAHEAEVTATLGGTLDELERAMAEERKTCTGAFANLVVRHDLPATSHVLTLRGGEQGYAARLESSTPYGLCWAMTVGIPESHAFAHVARVDKLVPQLEIQAPDTGGWLRKETRLRPHRLDRLFLTHATVSSSLVAVKLRTGADGSGGGFDVSLDKGGAARVRRVADDGTLADVDVSAEDSAKLQKLAEKIRVTTGDLTAARRALESATFDDEPMTSLGRPSLLVDRLVAAMAPTVKEIASRSLSPTELVLKRMVAGNRREELFVPKAELLGKLAVLPAHARERFAPLPLAGLPSMLPPPASEPGARPGSLRPAASSPPPAARSVPPPAESRSVPPPSNATPSNATADGLAPESRSAPSSASSPPLSSPAAAALASVRPPPLPMPEAPLSDDEPQRAVAAPDESGLLPHDAHGDSGEQPGVPRDVVHEQDERDQRAFA